MYMLERGIDGVGPVGVEKERRRAAVGQGEVLAGRPGPVGHGLVQPCVGGIERLPRLEYTARVVLAARAQGVEDDPLLWRRDVIVEEAVHGPYLERCLAVRG